MPMLLCKLTDDRVPIQPAFMQLALASIAFRASVSGRLEAARGAVHDGLAQSGLRKFPLRADERHSVAGFAELAQGLRRMLDALQRSYGGGVNAAMRKALARQPAVRVESLGDLPVMMDERVPVDRAAA